MAKYRLMGKTAEVLLMSFLIFSAAVILGDFSFFVSKIIGTQRLSLDTGTVKNTIIISACVFGAVSSLIVLPALKIGCERWFLLNAKGEKAGLKELFHYFSFFGIKKSVSAFLYCFFKKASALILFMFPSLCLFGVLYFSLKDGEISLVISYIFFAAASLLFAVGLVFYFVYTARFFVYYAIIVSNDTIKPGFALEKSAEITKNAYSVICFFRLSFLPWLIPCLLIFPSFYIWGYFKESKAMLCLKNEYLHS